MENEKPPTDMENLRRRDDNQISRIIDVIQSQTNEIRQLRGDVVEMTEVLTAWRNAKGTIKIVYCIGQAIKWTVATSAALSLLWYTIKK